MQSAARICRWFRTRALAALLAGLSVGALSAQEASLQFEVASIKPTEFSSDAYAAGFRAGAARNPCGGGTLTVSGTMIRIRTVNVCSMIRIAYGVSDYQVLGVPERVGPVVPSLGIAGAVDLSIASEAKEPRVFFEVEARAPGPGPVTEAQAKEMLRQLLKERCRLSLHREDRELPFYEMVAAKDGPKVKPADESCKPGRSTDAMKVCGQTMEQIARLFKSYADRPVFDKTGLAGKFDFEVPVNLDSGDFNATMLAAMQDALKLRLESRKGPIEVLVVDHVELPSDN